MNISLGTVEWDEPQTPVRRGLGKKLALTLIAITLASVAMMNTLASEPISLVEDGRAQAAEITEDPPATLDVPSASLEGSTGFRK
jgi:hypothetical protein